MNQENNNSEPSLITESDKGVKRLRAVPLRDLVLFPSMIMPLFVGREHSVLAIEYAVQDNDGYIFCVTQKTDALEDPKINDLHTVGTYCKVIQLMRLPDGSYKVLVEALWRARCLDWFIEDDAFSCLIDDTQPVQLSEPSDESLRKVIFTHYTDYIAKTRDRNSELMNLLLKTKDPSRLCDLIANTLPINTEQKQSILDIYPLLERTEALVLMLERELDWINTDQRIHARIKEKISEEQERYYKNQKLKAIQKELQEDGADEEGLISDLDELHSKIKALNLPKDSEEKVITEYKKLKVMPSMSSEASVIRGYLDWVMEMPWNKRASIKLDIKKAKQSLDGDHYGLEKVKDRILQTLAVQKRVKNVSGPVLCLVGPPGVGKTSLGQSVAKATGRPFIRISLGGVRDESEIRGHRKTYIGSMPGRIIKAMRRAKVKNPLILLDEIDKMGMDMRGDPASALLEVLDAEQNDKFSDHYLEIEFDLSEVMFMTTANSLNIPPALLDRMEIIRIAGYTEKEKLNIATGYLIPNAIKRNGLKPRELTISPGRVQTLIQNYTRESGVRSLDRCLNELCRKFLLDKLKRDATKTDKSQLSDKRLKSLLGVPPYVKTQSEKKDKVGIIRGLAWTQVGGEVLMIEAITYPGKGELRVTGSLGDVMKESIKTAWSLIKAHAATYEIQDEWFTKHDIHVHVPEGATPKDGPSAGIGMCSAMLSAITGVPIRHNIALTGEMTLTGDVLAIGGLKEKLLAALRMQLDTAIMPMANKKDLQDLPSEIKKGLNLCFVEKITEVFPLVLAENK